MDAGFLPPAPGWGSGCRAWRHRRWSTLRRGEVLPWPERRRRWSWEEKAQIVAESLAPNAVASAIARRYGLHRNQLYAWRKELSQTANEAAEAGGPAPLDFVPVVVMEDPAIALPIKWQITWQTIHSRLRSGGAHHPEADIGSNVRSKPRLPSSDWLARWSGVEAAQA